MTLKNILYKTMVLCCAAFMTGCSDDESIINPENGRLITFTTEDNWGDAPAQSRATRATSKEGTFSVEVITVDDHSTRATGGEPMTADYYGVYADYDDDGDRSSVQQFMNNQKVDPDNGYYEPVKYWSADPTGEYGKWREYNLH